MIKNKKAELNADDYLHFDIIPENNLNFTISGSSTGLTANQVLKTPGRVN